jgi:GT2 family glycosyltransferase
MPNELPLVYSIILTCGLTPDGKARKLLLATLESVKQMTYSRNRIVVVDNGSIDGSQEAVRSQHPDVVLVENGRNLGYMEGNNVGLRYVLKQKGEWVLLLNNDIAVDPSMLSEMMNVALADQRIGIVGPKIYYYDEPRKIWYAGGKINYVTGIISHRGIREIDRGQYDRVEETDYVTGCAVLIRRAVLDAIGLLDPIYSPMYSEDADFSVRAKRAGFRVMYVPRAKVWHKVSAFTGGGLTPFKTQMKVEHNLIFFKRYARWYHWITIPWCVGAVALAFVTRELFKGNFEIVSALFRGFLRALRRLSS